MSDALEIMDLLVSIETFTLGALKGKWIHHTYSHGIYILLYICDNDKGKFGLSISHVRNTSLDYLNYEQYF